MDQDQDSERKILFYDGECGFCNRSVQIALKADKRGRLRFAPLQGETAARSLPEELRRPEESGTMVLLEPDGSIKTRSEDALAAAGAVGGPWKLLRLGRALPRRWRDGVYDVVARNRHRLPVKAACELPDAEARKRFLP